MDLWYTEEMHMRPTVPSLAETQSLSGQKWQRGKNCLSLATLFVHHKQKQETTNHLLNSGGEI